MSDLLAAVASRRRDRPLWSSEHVLGVVAGNGLGLALVLAGWFQSAAADESVRHRLAWLAVSIVGLLAGGSANAWWLLRCRQAVALAREVVLGAVYVSPAAPRATVTGYDRPSQGVTGTAMTRIHDPSCMLAVGKDVRPARSKDRARLRTCEICGGGSGQR